MPYSGWLRKILRSTMSRSSSCSVRSQGIQPNAKKAKANKNQPSQESARREDVQAVMTAISRRSEAGRVYERATKSSELEITSRSEPHGGSVSRSAGEAYFWLDLRELI